jgi:hypothetical protein
MHSNQEFVSIDDVKCAIDAGKNMVKELGYKKYEYVYKPIVYTPQTVMNSLLQYDDDYEDEETETIHNLETIDVIEDKDGLYLIDGFDGNPFFVSDDDLPALYEIIRERLLSN